MTEQDLPAITGKQLIKLFEKDGWINCGRVNHGISMKKRVKDRTLVTVVPDKKASLPKKTLGQILSLKQTGIGTPGLLKLIKKYKIK